MTPAPRPCTARPATNSAMSPARPASSSPAGEDGDAPAAGRPAGRAGRRRRRRPPCPTTEATRKALNGQPYQASPSSSATAVGIAVPTAIASKAMKVTSISRPTVVRRCARSKTPAARRHDVPQLSRRRSFPPRTCVERRPRGDRRSTYRVPLSPCGR